MHCIDNFAIFRAARLEAEVGSVQNIKQCGRVAVCYVECGSVAEFGMSVLAAVVQAKCDAEYQSVGQQCCVWHSVECAVCYLECGSSCSVWCSVLCVVVCVVWSVVAVVWQCCVWHTVWG